MRESPGMLFQQSWRSLHMILLAAFPSLFSTNSPQAISNSFGCDDCGGLVIWHSTASLSGSLSCWKRNHQIRREWREKNSRQWNNNNETPGRLVGPLPANWNHATPRQRIPAGRYREKGKETTNHHYRGEKNTKVMKWQISWASYTWEHKWQSQTARGYPDFILHARQYKVHVMSPARSTQSPTPLW